MRNPNFGQYEPRDQDADERRVGHDRSHVGDDPELEARRFAETVRQSGQNLLRIVNEILDFAKVEAGKLALERVEFDVYETVEEVIDLVAERSQAKGLTLACEIITRSRYCERRPRTAAAHFDQPHRQCDQVY